MITDEQLEELDTTDYTWSCHDRLVKYVYARRAIALAQQVNLAKIEALLRNTEGMSTHAIKEQHVQWNAGVNAALAILRGER